MPVGPVVDVDPSSSRDADPRLQSALVEFLDLSERGVQIDHEAFLANHPDAGVELKHALESLQLLSEARRQLVPVDSSGTLVQPQLPLGDFRLVRELGRGGMGVVYEAVQRSLGRTVAVKVLPAISSFQPKQRQRFLTEAKAAAIIQHPNVVPIYAVDCLEGIHFYVMQFIDGVPLSKLIESLKLAGRSARKEDGTPSVADQFAMRTLAGEFAPGHVRRTKERQTSNFPNEPFVSTVATFIIQAADALSAAHQLGIIHRDIKPANLLLDGTGKLWVTDFGLARVHGDEALTLSGHLLGTVRYMSPEQARGSGTGLDHRTDVYSLGITFYEMLTLEPAFVDVDSLDLRRMVIETDPIRPRKQNRAVPLALETVLLKAIAKDPSARYCSAKEFADDLRRFLNGQPVLAQRPGWTDYARKWLWRRRLAVSAIGFAVFLGAVGSLIWSNHTIRYALDRAQKDRDAARRASMELIELSHRLATIPSEHTRQKEYLAKAQAFLEQVAGSSGDDVQSQFYLSRILRETAKVTLRTGDLPSAEPHFRQAISILKQLVANDPSNSRFRRELADCYRSLHPVLAERGRLAEAFEQSQLAVIEYQRLSDEQPNDGELLGLLAERLVDLGRQLSYQGRNDEATEQNRKAKRIYEQLFIRYPNDPQAWIRYTGSLVWAGHQEREKGNMEAAERFFREAVAIDERLEREFSARPDDRLYTLAALQHLGSLLLSKKRYADSEIIRRRYVNGRQKLAELYPDDWNVVLDAAWAHVELGQLLMIIDRDSDGIAEFRSGIVQLDRAIQRDVNATRLRVHLAELLLICPDGLRDPIRARKLAEQTVAEAPLMASGWRVIARAFSAVGENANTRSALEKTLSLDVQPTERIGDLFALVDACVKTDDRSDARRHLFAAEKLIQKYPWLSVGNAEKAKQYHSLFDLP